MTTVVFLHAFPLDERMWEPQTTVQGERLRLYDLPGSSMDGWGAAVMERFEGPLVLVGASMGGYCALAAASHAPERVAGLVLAGSRATPDTPEQREGRAGTRQLIREGGPEALWEFMRPKLLPEDADPELVERVRAIALDRDVDDCLRALDAVESRVDTSDVLAALGDRALVVLGDRDWYVAPEDVDAAHKHVLPNTGHLVSMERATEFNQLLEEALRRWT